MASGASSSLCLDTLDLCGCCEVTPTAKACGARRGAHQRGTPRQEWASPRLCTGVHRRPACTLSACHRQEGMGGIEGITALRRLAKIICPFTLLGAGCNSTPHET